MPDVVYKSGEGACAMIVDKYGSAPEITTRQQTPRLVAGDAREHGLSPHIDTTPYISLTDQRPLHASK